MQDDRFSVEYLGIDAKTAQRKPLQYVVILAVKFDTDVRQYRVTLILCCVWLCGGYCPMCLSVTVRVVVDCARSVVVIRFSSGRVIAPVNLKKIIKKITGMI